MKRWMGFGFKAWLQGIGVTVALMGASLGAFAALVAFTPYEVYYLSWPMSWLLFICPLLGGFAAGRRAARRGWLHGGGVGLFFGWIMVNVRNPFLLAAPTWLENGETLLWYTILGALGGVIAVNRPGRAPMTSLPVHREKNF